MLQTETKKNGVAKELMNYQKKIMSGNELNCLLTINEFPVKKVLEHYHIHGKHFVSKEVHHELKVIKDCLDKDGSKMEESGQYLSYFLNNLLDKHLEQYNYRSYISTYFLENLMRDKNLSYTAYLDTRIFHLITILCDIARFECETLSGKEKRFKNLLISNQKRKKRVLNLFKSIRTYSDFTTKVKIPDSLEEIINQWVNESANDSPVSSELEKLSLDFISTIQDQIPQDLKLVLEMSIIPVWVVHDEYMFIRVLQCFEMIFSIVIKGFLICQTHIQNGSFSEAESIMNSLIEVYRANPTLFRLLMTMDKDNFSAFRVYTEGASAIQSEQYKMIELLAAHPIEKRLNSPAFQSVPRLENRYKTDGIINFEEILKVILEDDETKHNNAFNNFLVSMKKFEEQFLLWKNTHYKIAIKVLGLQRGTGNTSGPSYLEMYVKSPLFPFLKNYEEESN
ncbi:hypothetical protein [Sporosarcina limicola]|uniref:Tryptophan 2,3-dioxygenase n=1 Tax=Sporosarcina limicola TaxID=34101 RepID=A0A927R8B0_9BACL|nr:hypothetical protein [Sporosarcina limicola]MBE1556829.1 tryptophan 2,3-dioxygenase [Sporosarcina limicola]